jgi:hypothetical protein
MKLIKARSSLAPAPVKEMKSLPLSFAARYVIGRVAQLRFHTPTAHRAIGARVAANWNALVRQIRSFQE